MRDVVGRRLNRLPDGANDVLSVAAVLGRDFGVEPLLAVVDAGEDEALDALDLAVRARLVEETSVDQYRFAHALVRTTLYEELSATRRRRLHRRWRTCSRSCAPTMCARSPTTAPRPARTAGDISRALRYTLAAAEQSLAARAFADAEAGFRSALELLEDGARTTTPPTGRRAVRAGRGAARPGRSGVPGDVARRVGRAAGLGDARCCPSGAGQHPRLSPASSAAWTGADLA